MALYFLFVIPPMILAMIAQGLVSSRYARAKQMPASLTGAAAARRVLDSAGLQAVEIERVPGHLTDHYDPSAKVLRLSDEVYDGRNLAAIGIAAHEAGHAIQDAKRYAPMVVRQLAVPAASFGSNSAFLLVILGAAMNAAGLILAGVACFGAVAAFQIINLPVEFNASSRAKERLAALGFVGPQEAPIVRGVLGAAALTYVAAMLSALMTFLYYALMFFGGSRDE